jgi:polysaccharide biosynthesis/export protein
VFLALVTRNDFIRRASPHRSFYHSKHFMNYTSAICSILAAFLGLGALNAEESLDTSYILRPNDTIRLEVYEESDLSGSVRILKTGQASFPLIGSVYISGMSVATAAAKIRELYAKDYLVDPKLILSVQDYSTDYISVLGAVKKPGQIPIPLSENLDLATAMATAGGPVESADIKGIVLIRASGATSKFGWMDIQEGTAGKIKLLAGDRVLVNQSAFVGKYITLLGQVKNPGLLSFPINGRLDLVSALAMAGGLTELANPRKVSINRKGKVLPLDYNEISQRGSSPVLLQPEDIVTVAERIF